MGGLKNSEMYLPLMLASGPRRSSARQVGVTPETLGSPAREDGMGQVGAVALLLPISIFYSIMSEILFYEKGKKCVWV